MSRKCYGILFSAILILFLCGCGKINTNTTSACGNGLCASSESCSSCPKDCGACSQESDYSTDADGIVWGTGAYTATNDASTLSNDVTKQVEAINGLLKTKNVKFRLLASYCTDSSGEFTADCAMPSKDNPQVSFNMDETVKVFKDNGWSMLPMLTYCSCDINSSADESKYLKDYPAFVEWFVDRYAEDADIRYLELENYPNSGMGGSTNLRKELLIEVQNDIYDKIKAKHPDILIGTPGFEYWQDDDTHTKNQDLIEYFLGSDAKFDFWAFHGYQTAAVAQRKFVYMPPTAVAEHNKYASIQGITEIRKKLDSRGWQNRLIIDTEHTFSAPVNPLPDDMDQEIAALTVQEILLKRTLQYNNAPVLSGIFPLKIVMRPQSQSQYLTEPSVGSLLSDGSASKHLTAAAFLLSKLNEYNYAGRVSGEYGSTAVWVEKFTSQDKELYVFFKPFEYNEGQAFEFDGETVDYTLSLSSAPKFTEVIDLYGNAKEVESSQTMTLEATNYPKYLEVLYYAYTGSCGDDICGTYESESSCAQDCSTATTPVTTATISATPSSALCGDGVCDDVERSHAGACPQDCTTATATPTPSPTPSSGMCGDGVCDDIERSHAGACPQDCTTSTATPTAAPTQTPSGAQGLCGDGVCDDIERSHAGACPQDCTTATATPTPSPTPSSALCGDGICDDIESRNRSLCPQDCD